MYIKGTESLWNEAVSFSTMTREAYQSKLCVAIPVGRSWRNLFIKREALVKLDLVWGNGGISFPVVRKVRFSKEVESSETVVGEDNHYAIIDIPNQSIEIFFHLYIMFSSSSTCLCLSVCLSASSQLVSPKSRGKNKFPIQ